MPAGDAGQAGQGQITLFNDTYSAILLELEALRAQLAAQQAVVAAARDIEAVDHGLCYPDLAHALAAFDKAQATQPEGERAR